MDEKIPTTKRRILELVKNKGFKVSKFFGEIGESYENYKGRSLDSSPSIDILEKIRTKIPDVNIEWILTGEGEMLNNHITQTNQNGDNINSHNVTVNKTEVVQLIELLKKKDEQIDRLLTLLEKK